MRFLGGHAAINAPYPSRFVVVALDASEESLQHDRFGDVTREHLQGERQALGRHHQGDNHLHAVGALIARVAKMTPALIPSLRVGFEVDAGEVIQEHP